MTTIFTDAKHPNQPEEKVPDTFCSPVQHGGLLLQTYNPLICVADIEPRTRADRLLVVPASTALKLFRTVVGDIGGSHLIRQSHLSRHELAESCCGTSVNVATTIALSVQCMSLQQNS